MRLGATRCGYLSAFEPWSFLLAGKDRQVPNVFNGFGYDYLLWIAAPAAVALVLVKR